MPPSCTADVHNGELPDYPMSQNEESHDHILKPMDYLALEGTMELTCERLTGYPTILSKPRWGFLRVFTVLDGAEPDT